MAHVDVVKAVEARIIAGFTHCPIYVENAFDGTPADGGAWLLIDFPWCRSDWISADEFQEEGGFRARLNVPAGEGAHLGREWLEEIAMLFRGQLFDGIQCSAPQSPSSDDRSDRAGYYRLELTVPYCTIIEG